MEQILHIINEMSPYLLLGFLLAGIMHAFVPGRLYSRYLAKPSFSSVLNAAILGIPLPLCSCGVIPTAMSLRKEGASKGSAVSFLIATPQTGVDSIVATYSLMGLPFAIVRPVVALVTALVGGTAVNAFDKGGDVATEDTECKDGCCSKSQHPSAFVGKLKEAFRYAFVDMMGDIGKWLIVGLVVAGLITVFVPDSFFAEFADNSLLSMLMVLVMAIPMYLCATGSIPIAVALMLKGLTPGAALVLLMAGPASNLASILVIRKVLGRRTMFIYLTSIIACAVGFGLVVDHFMPREWFVSSLVAESSECCQESEWFPWLCTIALSLLLFYSLVIRRYVLKKKECGCGEHCGDDDDDDDHCHCNHVHEMQIMVTGMNCNHCRSNAEKALREVEGVDEVTVDLASGIAHIKGHPEKARLQSALEALGFGMKG